MFSWLFKGSNGHVEKRGDKRKELDRLKAEVMEQTAGMDSSDPDTAREIHRLIDEQATKIGLEFPPEESIVSPDDDTKVMERT